MKLHKLLLAFSIFLILGSNQTLAQSHDLIGYWHNWNSGSAPYIQLDQVDIRYSIVAVSFAEAALGTDYQMEFIPQMVTASDLRTQIQTLKGRGQKVIISMGGANSPVSLDNSTERDTFIASMERIIEDYDFDGIDIDFEGSSITTSGGTISNPTDPKILYLIEAVQTLQQNYYTYHQKHLMLTMAPETAFVQGGQSTYGGIWGAYLPVIHALRDSLDILSVQLYNSGSMYGIDGNTYTQGTADFIVAMTEASIVGFSTTGGNFQGLPASKIAVGLPACSGAAGGGFTDTAIVASAMRYLLGQGPQPGTYVLHNPSGYSDLRGMMTWSINWDVACTSTNSYALNYENIFNTQTAISEFLANDNLFYPNPTCDLLFLKNGSMQQIDLFDITGKKIFTFFNETTFDLHELKAGIYFAGIGSQKFRIVKMDK